MKFLIPLAPLIHVSNLQEKTEKKESKIVAWTTQAV